MFGWFKASCPVDPRAKCWIEERLDWLADEFGLDVFTRRAMVLPLEEYFPDRYCGDYETVRVLLDRVCGYMDADPNRVELHIFDDSRELRLGLVNDQGHGIPTAAGLYDEQLDKTIIRIAQSQLSDPMDLVGTLAHELAHLRLLGEQRIDPEIFDNELLTDLTVVFHGLGIFLANKPRAWRSLMTTWPDSNDKRSEYMTQPMFGYALAHSAWFRGEQKPHWMKALRLDARTSFKQGVRYQFETRDSKFRPAKAP
jgi:hypothetical protein